MLPEQQLLIINLLLRSHPIQTLTQTLIQIPLKLQQHRQCLILRPQTKQHPAILKDNLQDANMVVAVSLSCYLDAILHLTDELIELLFLVEEKTVREVDYPGVRVITWKS